MTPRPIVLALLTLALALAPAAGRADEALAAQRFKEGTAAYSRKDFALAAKSFEAAHRAEPSGAALYNAGLAWEAAGSAPGAADDYVSALHAGGLDSMQARDAKKRLEALRKKLGQLEIELPPGARAALDDGESTATPRTRHAAPGDHQLTVTFADGQTARRTVSVAPGSKVPATFDAPAPIAPPPPPPPPPPAGSPLRVAGWVTIGLSGASAATAIGVGVAALGARDTFDDSHYTDRAAHDRAAALRLGANLAWVGAGTLAAGGILMVLLAPSAPAAPVAASLRAGPGTLVVAGSF